MSQETQAVMQEGVSVSDQDAVALLRGLVSIPSLSRAEGDASAWLARQMRGIGLNARVDEAGNAVGVRGSGGTGAKDIVLLGHIDTVAGWIDVRDEGDALYGRGSVDAKGSLATMTIAAATARLPAGVRVIVAGCVEEECPTSRGARYLATQYRPKFCVIGEPSGWDGITLGYKGRMLAELTVGQESSHTAAPGAGAAEIAVDWWIAMRELAREMSVGRERVFDQVQAALRSIQSSSDGLNDVATALVGFRLPPGLEPMEFEAACRTRGVRSGGVSSGKPRFFGHEWAHATDRTESIVGHFGAAIRGAGGTPRPKVKTGTSDMNAVAPVWGSGRGGCPIIAYGPGDSSLDHTPNEHILKSEFLRAIGVLREAIERMAGELSE